MLSIKSFLLPIISFCLACIILILPVGDIWNQFFPCIQDPQNSFPCQSTYELYGRGVAFFLMCFATLFGIIQAMRKYYWS